MYNILIIEDHKDFRQAVSQYLRIKKVKANLLEAATGKEGVELATLNRPEIVLMDFCLSGLNGAGAAAQIKANVPECSIILLSTFDLQDAQPFINREIIRALISKSDLCEKLIPHINTILCS
ncbi:MAG: response regulator transcription factor [Candidatus Omnitrophica bacterium]|nr:response regulator transcription factor [Candidatus Omnitrophota bacterium]MDE2008851.1 response regulator transcription factor [Candidatus Omnitrophota bacterium]MDE2213586.1 response regulator transcription factor [Candidatus Omnitrophota bacterium]MDE2230513.1 response regulator transcription factor [Candidatus Omnitrophota bacterium]